MPGVEADDIVALLDHRPPPGALDVVLELDAERPVVPDGVDATVDLGRGEDEAAALGKRDDGLEAGDGGRDVITVEIAGVGGADGRSGLVGHGRGWTPATDAQGRSTLSHGRRCRRSPTGPSRRAGAEAIEGPDGRLQARATPATFEQGQSHLAREIQHERRNQADHAVRDRLVAVEGAVLVAEVSDDSGVQAEAIIATDFTHTVIVAAFADPGIGHGDVSGAARCGGVSHSLHIDAVAVVRADAEGKIHAQKVTEHSTKKGLKWGVGAGIVLGVIFPPSLLAGAVAGGVAGSAIGKIRHTSRTHRAREGAPWLAAAG